MIQPTPFARRLAALLALAVVAFLPGLARAGAFIADARGTVEIRKPGSGSWGSITGAGHVLGAGDEIRTKGGSKATIQFDDGSKVEIGSNGSFQLEEAKADGAAMKFNLGFMKAWVSKTLARRFMVRTPTAVCSVRGTEFGVNVADGGNTNVNVFSGLVGVGDMKGNEVLLADGQSADVTANGIQQKSQGPSDTQGADRSRQALKREVGLDMTKEEVQAAAATEIKQAVYQEGKAIIDVNGNRVRIEEYIIRSAPNTFKFVNLSERVDRFDYMYYSATMNRNLPDDMSIALRQIKGQAVTKPDFFVSAFEIGRSNTIDSIVEKATGGHLVDVNNNADPDDNIRTYYDSRLEAIVNLAAGTPFWTALYDDYSLRFNGNPHTTWTRAGGVAAYDPLTDTGGVQSESLAAQVTRNDFGLNVIRSPNCLNVDNCTGNPQPGTDQGVIYRSNAGGTMWERRHTYVIDDEGNIATRGVTPGAGLKAELLNWNFQEVWTASEFNGRKIDLVYSPRVLIESGLIP